MRGVKLVCVPDNIGKPYDSKQLLELRDRDHVPDPGLIDNEFQRHVAEVLLQQEPKAA